MSHFSWTGRAASTLSGLMVLFVAGCGDPIKVVRVTGNVTVGGSEPFRNGTVIFVPKETTKTLGGSAMTDDNGDFVLQHASHTRTGIEPGDYTVCFSLFQMPDGSPLADQTHEPNPKTPAQLGAVQFVPREFNRPDSTQYPTTVPPSGGDFAFDLPELSPQKPPARPGGKRKR